jgi:leucyl/phenylalanyl-tRNA---protein transferase
MAVYLLNNDMIFPHPSLADENGLLAMGGDLSPERILTAYAYGIFPWYNKGEPIFWWSPNPRCVLFPENFKVSKSLRLLVAKKKFEISYDTNFKDVISNCAKVHQANDSGTWITPAMKKAYILLHDLGFAHSVEIYLKNELVGGLYGIAIGKVFYGESMFHTVSDASKVALYYLVERLKQWHFDILDNQTTTDHLMKFGSEEIDRDIFLAIIKKSIKKENHRGKW